VEFVSAYVHNAQEASTTHSPSFTSSRGISSNRLELISAVLGDQLMDAGLEELEMVSASCTSFRLRQVTRVTN